MDTLASRIQTLLKELYDEIYELVLTASPNQRLITSTYKPSSQLQVNKASREKFATSYFDGIFTFNNTWTLRKWLKKLAKKHRALIKQIHYADEYVDLSFNPPFRRESLLNDICVMIAREKFEESRRYALAAGFDIDPDDSDNWEEEFHYIGDSD